MSDADKQIEEIIKKIEAKKVEIEKDRKIVGESWKTSTKFMINGKEMNLKVAKIDDVKMLTLHLMRLQQEEEGVSALLEIESNKKVNGYTFENWISDCKKRVKTIQLDEKVKYLEEKTKVVESYYSEDKRRQKLLEKTLADLKDLGID